MGMEVDPPPEPPDPDGSRNGDACDASRQAASSRKRPVDIDEPAAEGGKRTVLNPPHAAVHSVYTHPSFSEGPKGYSRDDKGPFIVHVSKEVSDPSAATSIRALQFGQFLHHNKFSHIIKDGVKSVGRNRVSVEFSTALAANDFLASQILTLAKYKANIPTFNITRMGLVRGVPIDWSMGDFVESLELPIGCGEVLKARRLNRKNTIEDRVEWVPTQSVVVTFRGQTLPSRIFSFYTSLPVESYKFPTIQCLNCCRFGHIKSQCRSKPRCYRCAQPHTGESCDVSKEKATCLHCSGSHFASDKDCPEFSRQESIKLVMSQDNISYIEASARFPPVRRSYAEMTRELFSTPTFSPRPPHPTNSSRPNVTPKKSYRETIIRSPRPRAPLPKGYNKQAHESIINNPSSSLPNGCALGNSQPDFPLSQGKMLEDLTALLLSIVAPCSELPLPPNVAQNLSRLFNILNNGPNSSTSMEL
ncbi:uncharacterized protein [Maniola hyperantus]|uniref:uncharacterized protein n=1 Tax=Aphantopus hyperantus TaxID=2795564 RepID=UPI003749107A